MTFPSPSLWKVIQSTACFSSFKPRLADLHQIIRSGQILTNEHVQYFTYQILRGTKPRPTDSCMALNAPARHEVYPLRRGHPPRPQARQPARQRRLRAQDLRFRAKQGILYRTRRNRIASYGICCNSVVQGTRDHVGIQVGSFRP